MRYLVWYGVFSVVVGAVIATLLPALVLPYAAIAVLGGILLLRDLSKGKGPGSSSQEDERELRHAAGTEGAPPADSSTRVSTTAHDLPTTLDEALARFSIPPVPPGMRDPRTDVNLAAYARSLTTATWQDWQVVHIRADMPRVVDAYQALIGRIGVGQAETMCTIANRAGASVNSLVLGYFVRQVLEAQGNDPRLVRKWLGILDAHKGPRIGTVVNGAWGILLRDLLPFDARDECYQSFARCVDAALFGLEGVYATAERAEPDRLRFGPNGGEVAALLSALASSGPAVWEALLSAHVDAYGLDHEGRARRVSLLVDGAERRGIATGAITAEDGPLATRVAEEAAAKILPMILAGAQRRSALEPEVLAHTVGDFARSAAYTVAAVLVVRPFLEPGEFEELWAPYARVLGDPGVRIALDLPRDYRFVPELLRRGGKRVETLFVTVADGQLTEMVDVLRLGEPWAAVSEGFQIIAEGPSRIWVVAEITDMLAERVRQREAEGEVVLSFYRPDGTPVVDSEKWLRDGLLAKQRRRSGCLMAGMGLIVLPALVALVGTRAMCL